MKILVTGGLGQLAHEVRHVLGPHHQLCEVDLPEVDISQPSMLHPVVENFQPEIILNCAAYTRVDDCETDRDAAWRVNARGPAVLAETAGRIGARLIHISTDYVFSGSRTVPQPYVEEDTPGPVSWYGQTKLEGEQAIQTGAAPYAILRTAWLYGAHGRNFPKTILRLALKQPAKELKVVNDQFGSPTWAWRLARQIAVVIERRGEGIFHATSEGYGSWYDFALLFLKEMNVPAQIRPCPGTEYPTPARRPVNSILENRRLKNLGYNVMVDWREDVAEFARRERTRLLEELR